MNAWWCEIDWERFFLRVFRIVFLVGNYWTFLLIIDEIVLKFWMKIRIEFMNYFVRKRRLKFLDFHVFDSDLMQIWLENFFIFNIYLQTKETTGWFNTLSLCLFPSLTLSNKLSTVLHRLKAADCFWIFLLFFIKLVCKFSSKNRLFNGERQ